MPIPFLDLYPVETTATIAERKRYEHIVSTRTTCISEPLNYSNFINSRIGNIQSFTRFSIDKNVNDAVFQPPISHSETDYDLVIPLPIKKSFKVKGRIKSVSKLLITPSID